MGSRRTQRPATVRRFPVERTSEPFEPDTGNPEGHDYMDFYKRLKRGKVHDLERGDEEGGRS